MKFIKGFILAVALTLSFSVFAKSQEEVCYNTVEVEVELKRAFNSHPDQFNIYIDLLENTRLHLILKSVSVNQLTGFTTVKTCQMKIFVACLSCGVLFTLVNNP